MKKKKMNKNKIKIQIKIWMKKTQKMKILRYSKKRKIRDNLKQKTRPRIILVSKIK